MDQIDKINRSVYLDDKVCKSYLNLNGLFPVEEKLLAILRSRLTRNPRILDIGIGTGRTTSHLLSISNDYVGLDYSGTMVKLARENFPGVMIEEGDVRDLSQFKESEFELVFFSFNGLDYIKHSDRLKALDEVKRVLKKTGLFVFSSHNADYKFFDKWRVRWQPFGVRTIYQNLVGLKNRVKNLTKHQYEDDYAIITDPGHNYRLLTYYITPQKQKMQLVSRGFSQDVMSFDLSGNVVETSRESSWLYYPSTKK